MERHSTFMRFLGKNRGLSFSARDNHSPIPLQALFHFHGKLYRRAYMLRWALVFFVVALVAALLGFTGISLAAAGIAKILFYLFLILFLVTLMGHLLRRS